MQQKRTALELDLEKLRAEYQTLEQERQTASSQFNAKTALIAQQEKEIELLAQQLEDREKEQNALRQRERALMDDLLALRKTAADLKTKIDGIDEQIVIQQQS